MSSSTSSSTTQGKSIAAADPPKPRARSLYARSAAAMRWMHIYLSMVSFTALAFFAVTGITLNHPTWLGADQQVTIDHAGELTTGALAGEIDKLAIAELLRDRHKLHGRVAEFEVAESECMVVFKSPGYSADVFIDRGNGKYTIAETKTGLVAILNDLHKGRDSGPGWSLVIDVSAAVMVLVSLSGFGLLFFLKRRRAAGLLTALAGTILCVALWAFLIA